MSFTYKTRNKDRSTWNDFHSNLMAKYKKKDFEDYYKFKNKHYKIKVYSPEKDYIIISFTDITEEYTNKEQNKIKERILYSCMEFTQELLTNENLYSALSNGIEMLGNATQVDRVYYWENHYDEDSKKYFTSQKIEWCLDGVEQQIDNPELQNIAFEKSIDFIGTLSKNKPFKSHVKDMDYGENSTKQVLEAQGIFSILTIPIFLKDEFKGFIGFDSCKVEKEWSQVEISLLNSFVLLYIKALEKNLLEKSIVQIKENFYNFFNMIEDLFLVLDLKGNIIYVNDNVLSRLNYSKEDLIGKSYLMLHPQNEIKQIKKNFQDILSKKAKCFNVSAVTKEGEIFPVETTNTEGIWNGEAVVFAVAKDISELTMSEDKFSKAFNNSIVSMFISKFEDGEILDVNNNFLELIGYTRKEVIGRTTLDLQMTKDYQDRETFKNKIKRDGKISDLEIEIISKIKKSCIGLLNIVPININNEKCLLSSIIDITDRVEYEKKILEISNRDSLTGIYNRKYVYERAEERIQEYKRNNKLFSVGIIDIDDFKNINDQYGHQVGDYVLKEFAKTVKDNLRLYDKLGRYGGEEFIVVFNYSDGEKSNLILERILSIIRKRIFSFNRVMINLTFSAGISSCIELEKDETSIDKLVEIADKRMYTAKNNGKNKIVYKDI